MAETYLTLGQAQPTAGALTTLYTVPAATQTIVSSLTIANPSTAPDGVAVSIAPGGAADTAAQYLIGGPTSYAPLLPGNTVQMHPLAMAATDVLRVRCQGGNCSFNASGVQLT